VPIGIGTVGEQVGYVVDSSETTQTLRFDRPTEVPIYIIIDVIVDALNFPADGATEIQNSIVLYGDAFAVGKDAVARSLGAQSLSVDGVLDFPHCYIGVAPSPGSETTIVVDNRSLATFSTTNITVNVTDGTP
jgi:hypothetical protein